MYVSWFLQNGWQRGGRNHRNTDLFERQKMRPIQNILGIETLIGCHMCISERHFCRILQNPAEICSILQDSAEFCCKRASTEKLVKVQLLQKQYCLALQIWEMGLILWFLNISDVAPTRFHTQNYVLQKLPRESILQDFRDSAESC